LREASRFKIEEATSAKTASKRSIRLHPGPLEARMWYTEMGYSTVNPYLRDGAGSLGSLNTPETEVFVDKKIRDMDEAFDLYGVTVESPVDVGRGMGFDGWWADDVLEAFRVGSVAVDRGYVSTTSEDDILGMFSNRTMYQEPDPDDDVSTIPRTGVAVRITVPRGTRVLAGKSSESELILPRGLKYRVVSARKTSRRFVEVHMEVVQ
jgi:hypothetical protein